MAKNSDGSLTLKLDVLEGADKISADKILLAMGRPPNVDGLTLKNTEVKIDKSGAVVVDEY